MLVPNAPEPMLFIVQPELHEADLLMLNESMQLAGSKYRFIDKLRPPPGPGGVSRVKKGTRGASTTWSWETDAGDLDAVFLPGLYTD